MFVEDFLAELDALLEDVDVGDSDELQGILDELIPELVVLCNNGWLLELIVEVCKRRK